MTELVWPIHSLTRWLRAEIAGQTLVSPQAGIWIGGIGAHGGQLADGRTGGGGQGEGEQGGMGGGHGLCGGHPLKGGLWH